MIRHNIVKHASHRALRHGKARSLRIGAVAHQCQHAFLSNLSETLQINGVPKDRRIIHLEVSRMNDNSRRGINSQSGSIHNAVICLNKLDSKCSQIDRLPMLNHLPLGLIEQIVLAKLVLNKTDGQLGCIDGNIDFLQNIGKSTDVILMSVGDHKALDLLNVVL